MPDKEAGMRFIVFPIVYLAFSTVGFSDTLHVPTEFLTIQDAIDAAKDGDTVMVAPGTYVENISFKGKAITVVSTDGPDLTFIDGNQAGSVVLFALGEGPGSKIEGFTIQNGSGTYVHFANQGGGICCYEASPRITNNVITRNGVGSTGYGGGISCRSSSSPQMSRAKRSRRWL